jgi:hypothetical protein
VYRTASERGAVQETKIESGKWKDKERKKERKKESFALQ